MTNRPINLGKYFENEPSALFSVEAHLEKKEKKKEKIISFSRPYPYIGVEISVENSSPLLPSTGSSLFPIWFEA